MANKPEIIQRLEKNNTHDDKIKIRAREKSAGGYTIYLDFFNKGKRELFYLSKDLHLTGTQKELQKDKDKLAVIKSIRDEKQNDLLKAETGYTLSENKKDFSEYFGELANKKDKVFKASLKHFTIFTQGKKTTFDKLNYNFCQKFAEYLKSVVEPNSAQMYFTKFKATINQAIREDILTKSPAMNVIIEKADTKREFLTLDEVKALSATPKPNIDTCNAFLFSCFTGLRISDLRALTFDQIQDGYLEFKQQKTGQNERIKLKPTALKIIEIQAGFKRSDKVFDMQTIINVEKHLKQWTLSAGISKHITFHCSRHTFATLALTNDIDLFTVSKLLGHRDIKTTQIYAKLIDKKKDEAIDKLPDIEL